MKKTICILMLAAATLTARAQVTPRSQMERLDRGAVAIPITKGIFLSWRLLGTDNKDAIRFTLLRDGEVVAEDLAVTNYKDSSGKTTSQYELRTFVGGELTESVDITPWAKRFKTLKLDRPAGGVHASWDGKKNVGYAYYPNDMSVGDVDGDGQYELFLKWESTHAQDNSYSKGYTGNTYIDCIKLTDDTEEGYERLWRINLGRNIRDGAHYTQFMVYDFDGDGRAEMMCRTATGSKDGTGAYVNQAATDATIKGHSNTKDYRNSGGHVLDGPEYLTVFDGMTGKALHTTWYLPNRAGNFNQSDKHPSSSYWGDSYGNRADRFLAAVACLDGPDKPASAIFCRGYYTRAFVWAVAFDGKELHTKWLHDSETRNYVNLYIGDDLQKQPRKAYAKNTGGVKSGEVAEGSGTVGSCTLFANGNHNMSIADVDGDGRDEILWGAGALDDDGTLLYATGYGHGDAMHVGKMIPDREGLQVFDVHEEKLTAAHGSWDLHDAATGEIIFHGGNGGKDNGRGMAADLLPANRGYEFWSSDERNPKSALTGKQAIAKSCSVNFRIYWDGTAQDQLLDGSYKYDDDMWAQSAHAEPVITKWNGSSFANVVSLYSYNNAQTANYTKATPCLQADLFGDWREELVLWNKEDSTEIMIFTTWTPTTYAVPTLMHDHTYRMAIAWQNTAYNQPPHLGYFLRDYIDGLLPEPVGIADVERSQRNANGAATAIYDLQGQRRQTLRKGLNIVREGNTIRKVISR